MPFFFFGGSGRRAVAHTRPVFPKNAYGSVGIPLIRGASGAGRLTQPPWREWKPGWKAPWGRRKSPGTETHSARSAPRQHGRPKCYPAPGEVQPEISLSPEWFELGPYTTGVFGGICWPPHLTGNCGTRPFLWWFRAQGRSPHAPGISQKCLRPRRHSSY